MILIGLTGGIASGKSTVSGILREMGANVIDADAAARKVVEKGSPLLGKIAAAFGRDVLLPDGSLDRMRLGERVFGDEKKRQALNDLMHPEIRKELLRRIDAYAAGGERAVFLDIPLLFETPWHTCTEENWVVYVDLARQLKRLMKRNGFSKQQALARIQSQMSLCDKRKLADVVIDNNGDLSATRRQVQAAWAKFAARAGLEGRQSF